MSSLFPSLGLRLAGFLGEPGKSRYQETDKLVGVGQDTSGVALGEVKAVAELGRGQQMQLKMFLGLVLLLGLVLYSVLLHFALQASRCTVKS